MTEPVDQRLSANHAAGRPGSVSVDLDALRTLAEQATPGPWKADAYDDESFLGFDGVNGLRTKLRAEAPR